MAEAIEQDIVDGPEATMAPDPVPGAQLIDIQEDLLLSDSSSSLSLDTLPPTSVAPASSSTSESTISSLTPTQRVTPRMHESGTADHSYPKTLHEGILLVDNDLEQLVSLNSKVTPTQQLDLLWRIHSDLTTFMAPYRIYHG